MKIEVEDVPRWCWYPDMIDALGRFWKADRSWRDIIEFCRVLTEMRETIARDRGSAPTEVEFYNCGGKHRIKEDGWEVEVNDMLGVLHGILHLITDERRRELLDGWTYLSAMCEKEVSDRMASGEMMMGELDHERLAECGTIIMGVKANDMKECGSYVSDAVVVEAAKDESDKYRYFIHWGERPSVVEPELSQDVIDRCDHYELRGSSSTIPIIHTVHCRSCGEQLSGGIADIVDNVLWKSYKEASPHCSPDESP